MVGLCDHQNNKDTPMRRTIFRFHNRFVHTPLGHLTHFAQHVVRALQERSLSWSLSTTSVQCSSPFRRQITRITKQQNSYTPKVKTNNTTLRTLMIGVTLTSVILHATVVCLVPQKNGMCGWANQVDDPSNDCCGQTGPGQIQRTSCLGTGATAYCNPQSAPYSYTFTSYTVETYVTTDHITNTYCGDLTPFQECIGDGTTANPSVRTIYCDNAVALTGQTCSSGTK